MIGDVDGAADIAAAAIAAEGDADIRRLRVGVDCARAESRGDAHAAITAAAADALTLDADRVVASRLDEAAVGDVDFAAGAAAAAIAAERYADRFRVAAREDARERKTAIAAAAADRLREDRVRRGAAGHDAAARVLHVDRARGVAGTAGAADRHRHLLRAALVVGRGRERAAGRETAIAAAAADRLRDNAVGIIARGLQHAGVGDIDFFADAAIAGRAADRDRRVGRIGLRAESRAEAEAAIAAAAADRLRDNRRRRIAGRGDSAVIDGRDHAGVAAGTAIAAERDRELRAVLAEAAGEARGKTARATAAADRLRFDAVR